MARVACGLLILVLSFVLSEAATCPSTGIYCPTNCGSTFQQCSGSTFYPAQACAAGTVCSQAVNNIVATADCSGGSAPTPAPTTKAPTPAPTTKSPTPAPTTKSPTPAPTPSGSCSLSTIFSQAQWNALFPNANFAANRGDVGQYPIFTYNNFITAAASYPAFACTGDETTRKRELAAFLGQTSHETSGWWAGQPYNWGYVFSTELCVSSGTCNSYLDTSKPYSPGKQYYGRGPIQLSWNTNYYQASQAILGNGNTLVNNPDQVLTDGVIAFKTALWFWMTTQLPKPSCHDVITGIWTPSSADIAAGRLAGYGALTNIINGGIECSIPTTAAVTDRVNYYQTYANYFGVSVGNNLYCNNMAQF